MCASFIRSLLVTLWFFISINKIKFPFNIWRNFIATQPHNFDMYKWWLSYGWCSIWNYYTLHSHCAKHLICLLVLIRIFLFSVCVSRFLWFDINLFGHLVSIGCTFFIVDTTATALKSFTKKKIIIPQFRRICTMYFFYIVSFGWAVQWSWILDK